MVVVVVVVITIDACALQLPPPGFRSPLPSSCLRVSICQEHSEIVSSFSLSRGFQHTVHELLRDFDETLVVKYIHILYRHMIQIRPKTLTVSCFWTTGWFQILES